MAHECSSLLIHCMDFRIQGSIYQWLEDECLLGDCDVVSVAGASKSLDEEDGDFLMDQINTSYNLHNMRILILMNHTDCGAYGGRKLNDDKFHTEVMTQVEKMLSEKYHNLTIRKVLCKIHEDGDINFQEV